jgi:RimJ/RimL family protein N-acetyltransferase
MVTIHKANAKDLDAVNSIYAEAYTEVKSDPMFGDYLYIKKPDRKSNDVLKKRIYADIKKGNCIFNIAEENGKKVGFCFVTRKIAGSELSHVGILGVRVLKDWRGLGIGSDLISKTLNDAKGRFEIIEIYVLGFNTGAKRLYRRLGFKRWGIARRYMKRNGKYYNLEYMYLDL